MAGRNWNPEKYAARKPLSTIVNREVRLVRAPLGSQHWKEGLLRVEDVATGEILAVITSDYFRDPGTGWDLRTDC